MFFHCVIFEFALVEVKTFFVVINPTPAVTKNAQICPHSVFNSYLNKYLQE